MTIAIGLGIAFAGAIVAIMQLWIAVIRLRMDLLKPRLEVYDAFGKYLGLAMTHGAERGDPETAAAYDLYPKIGFLFGDDVRQLCEEILNAETRRRISTHALQHGGGVRDEQIDMNQKALESLNKCREALEGTFKPYLNVSTIAVPISGRLFAWIYKKIENWKNSPVK